MVNEEIIKEAAKRGIVPGARIKCASGNGEDVVPPIEEWVQEISGSFHWGKNNTLWRWGKFRGDWATVITPAPSSDTLKPGMATACGPAMRAAIMERAKELGIYVEVSEDPSDPDFVGMWVINFRGTGGYGKISPTVYRKERSGNEVPTHEFLRLMENTKPPKKELTTEEKLAEAVRLIERFSKVKPQSIERYTDGGIVLRVSEEARAFLKSIKP